MDPESCSTGKRTGERDQVPLDFRPCEESRRPSNVGGHPPSRDGHGRQGTICHRVRNRIDRIRERLPDWRDFRKVHHRFRGQPSNLECVRRCRAFRYHCPACRRRRCQVRRRRTSRFVRSHHRRLHCRIHRHRSLCPPWNSRNPWTRHSRKLFSLPCWRTILDRLVVGVGTAFCPRRHHRHNSRHRRIRSPMLWSIRSRCRKSDHNRNILLNPAWRRFRRYAFFPRHLPCHMEAPSPQLLGGHSGWPCHDSTTCAGLHDWQASPFRQPHSPRRRL